MHKKSRSEHRPQGDPCARCGRPFLSHRVKHKYQDGCCDLPRENHRERSYCERNRSSRKKKKNDYFVGLDGEGQGRDPHVYFLLAAADEAGQQWFVEDLKGLGTDVCLDFILSLPLQARVFAYSFGYDLCKLLKDIPAKTLFKLMRPDTRRGKFGPKPVTYGRFKLNLVATKFTVEDTITKRRRTVWDVWRFFRGKFVSALRDWKIQAAIQEIETMKEKRSDFDRESKDAVRAYCFAECQALASLVNKLTSACQDAGIELVSYYGAGSIASAILDKMNIKELLGEIPPEMCDAVSRAFFGGRFEHTVVGPIEGEVLSYDISSAYPYQTCFLPCLVHAHWEKTRSFKKMKAARHACVHYRLLEKNAPEIWGPFPFRTLDGSIIFPAVSDGGWVWRDEFLMALKHFDNIEFVEAWVLESDCDCPLPFAQTAEFYLERLRLGKEAAGTILKLGMNSEYGKLAQSSGSAPYQNWVWAGMVTSGTRAQFLELLGLHSDWSNMLIVATDGVYTREKINCPEPRDTGTSSASKFGKWPLGAWDPPQGKVVNGIFAARPGVYFPLNPTDADVEAFRARGLSRSVLVREWRRIQDAWYRGDKEVQIPSVSRFVGAKSGTLRTRNGEYRRTESCGEWVEREIKLSFDPAPKRGPNMEILRVSGESLPYKKSVVSPEAELLAQTSEEENEQPDGGDLTDYDDSF